MKTITSRYGDKRYIEQLEIGLYSIYGESHYMRGGELLDFEGGPIFFIGCSSDLLNNEEVLKIERGDSDKPNYYLIYTDGKTNNT
jgi:hypothetical protein